jgi:hypothetical protein
MALDYKTLQVRAASQATGANGCCPESDQLPNWLLPASSRRATTRAGWHCILAAFGVYLAVAFGLEARDAQRLAATRLQDLRQVAPRCVSPTGVDPRCADTAAARGLDPLMARLARLAAAEREARCDLAVAALGALATLAGLAAATRPPSQASRRGHASSWARVLQAARDVLALGASAMVPMARLLVAASGSLALARLLKGAPPSGELVAWSVHRAIELVFAVVQNA